jgi:UDP-N-acetylglucosamine transferase subunit ALG13
MESQPTVQFTAVSELHVLVLVGTDVHPFDRLLGWVENYTARGLVTWTIQSGSSRETKLAGGSPFLDRAQLATALETAHVVICHGGPATITEARRAGHKPLCVPRDPKQGEHVDDHQQRFARRLGRSGLVQICETEEELHAALERAESKRDAYRIDNSDADAAVVATALQIGRIADGLVSDGPQRVPRQARRAAARMPVTSWAPRVRVPAAGETITAAQAVPTADRTDRARVLYIGGWGRSGSTLAERLLGQMPEIFGAGEITHLWQRGLIDNELCACGTPFRECPFWSAVGDRAFGGWDMVDPAAVLALKHRVDRTRFVPRLALPTWLTRRRYELARYTDLHRALYVAITEVAGKVVVIDSSKHESLAFALRHDRSIDMSVLHLVRDGRGVAFSWKKQVRRPEAGDSLMPQYSLTKSGVLWTMHNWMFHLLNVVHPQVERMRYEDLVADPHAKLAEIRQLLDLPTADAAFLQKVDGALVAQVGASHSIAGNPMRFTSGQLALRTDSAWRSKGGLGGRAWIGLLTWPGRVRYGYLDTPGQRNRKGRTS